MIRLAMLLWLLAWPALAQDLPAQFGVSGVAADDVLNIRAAPDAASDRIGSLGSDEINVEVLELSENGRWGRIALPEGNGWVSMRYLLRQEVAEGEIPRPLVCLGTEPFWRLGLYPRGDEFERLGEDRVDLERTSELVQADGFRAELAGSGSSYGLTVVRRACSDGMSDRAFGWAASLTLTGSAGDETLQGCCTLDGR